MKFYLKDKDKDTTLIYLVYHFDKQRFKYSTGQKIAPDEWNQARQRPRKGHSELTTLLERISTEISIIHRRGLNDGATLSKAYFKHELDKFLGKQPSSLTLMNFYKSYQEEHRPDCKVFKAGVKILQAYPKAKNFKDINVAWLNQFTKYLEGKNYSANYIGKQIELLRQVLNEATERGINRNMAYRSNKYKKPSEDTDSIYLTIEELIKIHRADLPKHLHPVRDLFLIGAFTGLRFSDVKNLSQDKATDFIRLRQQKTSGEVVIPLHWIVREILERGIPKAPTIQWMDVALKVVGKQAGINEKVIKTFTKGGKREEKVYEKWQLIGTHTARRSAATNMFLSGIPAISIMKITGHKTESSFMSYIKVSGEQNAINLSSHPFFLKSS